MTDEVSDNVIPNWVLARKYVITTYSINKWLLLTDCKLFQSLLFLYYTYRIQNERKYKFDIIIR